MNSKYPQFPDGVHPKTNDFIRLQEQVQALTNAIATMVSPGVISGLTIVQVGQAPSLTGTAWDYGTGHVEVQPGVAIAEDGSILIIEDVISISNADFYLQTTTHNTYIYASGTTTLNQRPDILGRPQVVYSKPTYAASTTNPGSPKQFILCGMPAPSTATPTLVIPALNYSGRVWTHTGGLDGASGRYAGPVLGENALQNDAIKQRHLSDDVVGPNELGHNSVYDYHVTNASIEKRHIKAATNSPLNGIDNTQIQPNWSLVPVGTILPFAGIFAAASATTAPVGQNLVPAGWLVCDGTHYVGSAGSIYERLWWTIGTYYGGVGQADFAVPDLRGVFLRGYDSGRVGGGSRNLDPARAFGSYQVDTFGSHNHQSAPGANTRSGAFSNNSYSDWCDGDSNPKTPGSIRYTSTDGGTETRPKNVAMSFIIKY